MENASYQALNIISFCYPRHLERACTLHYLTEIYAEGLGKCQPQEPLGVFLPVHRGNSQHSCSGESWGRLQVGFRNPERNTSRCCSESKMGLLILFQWVIHIKPQRRLLLDKIHGAMCHFWQKNSCLHRLHWEMAGNDFRGMAGCSSCCRLDKSPSAHLVCQPERAVKRKWMMKHS